MTSIDFYFNAEDRLQVACRLAAKAASQNKRIVIYAPEGDTASRIDKLLWTWQATGFLPHCAPHDALAAETPVLIAAGEETPGGFGVLLNHRRVPAHFRALRREVVGRVRQKPPAAAATSTIAAGLQVTNHDLAMFDEENPPVLPGSSTIPARAAAVASRPGSTCPPHWAGGSRLQGWIDRVIQEKLTRTLNHVLGQALDGVRAELTVSVTQMVREAVASSVAHALAPPDQR
jgi:DNA polymerase-3 subunit chi